MRKFDKRVPEIVKASDEEGRIRIEQLKRSGAVVYDGFDAIVRGSFEREHPDLPPEGSTWESYKRNMEARREDVGVWVYFPWESEIVRYPDEADYHAMRTYRFRDLLSEGDLQELRLAKVAVLGMSVGGNVAVSLAQNAVGGSMLLCDGAVPTISGIGRAQFDMRDMSGKKVDAISRRISRIDPFLKQEVIGDYLSQSNIAQLEKFHPSVVFDEVDSMATSALIRKWCQKKGVPYIGVNDVHDRVVLEVCRHDREDAPLYAGGVRDRMADRLLERDGLSELEEMLLFGRSVGIQNLSPELVRSSARIGETLSGFPQLGSTAVAAAGVATVAGRDIILGRGPETGLYATDVSLPKGRGGRLRVIREVCRVLQKRRGSR